MGFNLTGRFTYMAPTLLVLLSACSQADPPEIAAQHLRAEPNPALVADTCKSNTQIAVDFLNLYIRHMNDQRVAADPPDTYEWLKSNSLVDPSVASAYATFDAIDGDPILDAQDYPDTFEPVGCPGAPDIVLLQGVGLDLKVRVKLAPVIGGTKVVGVGRINMPAPGADGNTAAQPAHLVAAPSKSPSGVVGTGAECVAGRDGAADLGSSYNEGMYLCRENVGGPYYNDWYVVVAKGRSSTYRVTADGKVMFEGLLTINCSGETTSWAKIEGFHTDAVDVVPATAVDNVLQIACRS